MRCVMAFRALALLVGIGSCGAISACQGSPPAASPSGAAGAALELDVGAPAIRFAVKDEPLVGLTASDGTGLKLAELTAQAVVDGSVAFTELRLTFDNPESRTLEGRFRIALPSGASLQRFAMKIGDAWQESEVVELTAAREAYEDALHRKQDPALLESSADNEFSARVFPIPANARKELVVSYVQELRQDAYTLPLRGLPEIGRLDAQVTVVSAAKQPPRLTLSNDKPSADLVVDLGDASTAKLAAIRAGELVVVRVKPQAVSNPDPLVSTIVMVDTSASRALGFEEELRSVALVVSRAAAAKGHVTLATFDQEVTPMFDGPASSFGDADLARIRKHGPLGASHLERALAWAGEAAKKGGQRRVVLVTDGVATAGATDGRALTAAVSSLRASGIERIDAVATGGIRDEASLAKLVRNNLAHDGVVVPAGALPTALARKLDEATRSGIAVQVDGASWSWPAKLDGVQAGDELSIYAEIPTGKPVRIALDGAPAVTLEPRTTARPLVERVVAQAQIASMLERELVMQQDLKQEITAVAVRHRVLTPYTAMLVLETEDDYARFHIDRRTPPEVLAIDDGKIIRASRSFRGMNTAIAPIEVPDAPTVSAGAREPRPSRQPHGSTAAGKAATRPATSARHAPPADAASLARPAAPSGAASSAPQPSLDVAEARGGGSPAPRLQARAAPPQPAAPVAAPRPVAVATSVPPAAKKKRPLQREESDVADPWRNRVADAPPPPPPPAPSPPAEAQASRGLDHDGSDDDLGRVSAYTGRFKEIMDQLAAKDEKGAFANASAWRGEAPADVMALIALGEVAEARGAKRLAARAYGSLIDLFANRADLRRFAGERLERLGDPAALALAIDTFEKARADRPDHPASHRLLAMAHLRAQQPEKAFAVLATGVQQRYPTGRFAGVDRILREDLGLAAAAWIKQDPKHEDDIRRQLRSAGGVEESGPSLRFVLVWETDANDVDFHIYDREGNHAFYNRKILPSGGELYADVTTGYGPECFTIRASKAERLGPYKLQANYYSRGPMGYGMGKLQVVEHDGKGNLTFQERPFVVMNDHAFVDLGVAD